MTNLTQLLILVACVALSAVLCKAESPNEMKRLAEGFVYANYYCPRCGRSVHCFDGQSQIKNAGNYSALVDKIVGPCNPHPWESVSSMSSSIKNNVVITNKNGSTEQLSRVYSVKCSDGMRNFVRGFAERVATNSQFIQVITYIGETNKAECEEVMNWFCSVSEAPTNATVLIDYLVEPNHKEKAASNLINIIGNGRPDLTSQAYLVWKQKYLYVKKEPQPTNSSHIEWLEIDCTKNGPQPTNAPYSSPAAGSNR